MRPRSVLSLVLSAAGLVVLAACSPSAPPAPPVVHNDQLPDPAPIQPIEPGTKIDPKALPAGTHLIFRSQPKVTSGDASKLNKSIRAALENFTTLVLLDVEPDPARAGKFRRKSHRIGIGKPRDGVDVVVTRDTAKEAGVSLGIFERKVLSGREEELATVMSPGATPTAAFYDFTMVFRRDDKPTPVVARYFALVNPDDGSVTTLYWVLDVTGKGYAFHGDSIRVLPANHVMDWELHIDSEKVSFSAPHPDAFTSTKLPVGEEINVPVEFQAAAAARTFTADTAAKLEQQARTLLSKRP